MSELKAITLYDAYWKATSDGDNSIPVYLKSEADEAMAELKKQHDTEIKELEHHWRATLYSREQEVAMEVRRQEEQNRKMLERIGPQPRNFFEDVCNIIQTCDKEGNTVPAYDFLRGLVAGWWLCNEVYSPENVENKTREWPNGQK